MLPVTRQPFLSWPRSVKLSGKQGYKSPVLFLTTPSDKIHFYVIIIGSHQGLSLCLHNAILWGCFIIIVIIIIIITIIINSLCAELFSGYMKIYLHLLSLPDSEMVRVHEIFTCGRHRSYTTTWGWQDLWYHIASIHILVTKCSVMKFFAVCV